MARRLVIPAAALLLGLIALRLVVAALLPIVEDEAYYVLWGRTPDAGYYDHPPFVAWIAMTERLSPGSPFAARLGSMAVAALAFPFLVGLFARCDLGRRGTIAALLLATCNVYALAIGVLVLPDAVMFTAWCAALHEAAAALQGRRSR
jgi:4-amino-4-deoxy-L-arabinose transferase-like glycosyltransferase